MSDNTKVFGTHELQAWSDEEIDKAALDAWAYRDRAFTTEAQALRMFKAGIKHVLSKLSGKYDEQVLRDFFEAGCNYANEQTDLDAPDSTTFLNNYKK